MVSGRKIARNVMAMATGEAPAEVATAELPEFVKTIQETVCICHSLPCILFCCMALGLTGLSNSLLNWVDSGIKLKISMQ